MNVNLATAWVDTFDLGFGTLLFVCRSRESDGPLGVSWVRPSFTGQNGEAPMAEVLECFVVPYARRQGVMRTIMNRIVSDYATVRTDKGTTDGLPFLRAYGFKLERGFGWVYRRPGLPRRRPVGKRSGNKGSRWAAERFGRRK